MTVREAEAAAAQLLKTSWWASPAQDRPVPVDPAGLARGLGIEVRLAPLPPDESGNIVIPVAGDVVISLNMWDGLNRQRFTCAHEIGHYLRDQGRDRDQTRTDYRATLAGLGRDVEEIYANQFAAALLMPAHLVARWHAEGLAVDVMAKQFETSTQAMELRLSNLRLG